MRGRWLRRRWKWVAVALLLLLFGGANAMAFMQAWSMTHFASGTDRTARPEELGLCGKLHVLMTGVKLPRPANTISPADLSLPFETRIFPSTDGIRLEAWLIPAPGDAGQSFSRNVVALFHPYTASKSASLAEAKAFHDLGWTCLLVDFRGSGGSAGNTTTIGYAEAADVVAAVAYCKKELGATHVVAFGQSMGAAAILRAVGRLELRPDAIILESPFDRLLSTVENRFHTMGLPAEPGSRMLVFWGGVQNGYWGFKHNPADYARGVTCPVLLMHGTTDPRVTSPQAQAIFDALAAANKKLVLFNGTHLAMMSVDRDLWVREVTAVLDRVASGGRPSLPSLH